MDQIEKGQKPHNPLTMAPLTAEDIFKLNKKLYKLGLDTVPTWRMDPEEKEALKKSFFFFFDDAARLGEIPSFLEGAHESKFFRRLFKYNIDNWLIFKDNSLWDGGGRYRIATRFELPPQVKKYPLFYSNDNDKYYKGYVRSQRKSPKSPKSPEVSVIRS
jgi:hypothetical protein